MNLDKYKFKNRLLLIETSNYTNENYKKVKEFKNKIVPKGLKFKVGKDKIGISYSKKF